MLLHAYGTGVLTEPWNPYMPVLWWLLFLLAVWSVLCGDLAMLPVAVFAASFCMQTHVSYLGLVGGMAGLAVLVVGSCGSPTAATGRACAASWPGPARSVLLGLVLWTPPLIDQIINDPGNASMIVKNFRNPNDDPLGVSRAAEVYRHPPRPVAVPRRPLRHRLVAAGRRCWPCGWAPWSSPGACVTRRCCASTPSWRRPWCWG